MGSVTKAFQCLMRDSEQIRENSHAFPMHLRSSYTSYSICNGLVCLVTRLRPGQSVFESRQGQEVFSPLQNARTVFVGPPYILFHGYWRPLPRLERQAT